jgi:hypothetical protein
LRTAQVPLEPATALEWPTAVALAQLRDELRRQLRRQVRQLLDDCRHRIGSEAAAEIRHVEPRRGGAAVQVGVRNPGVRVAVDESQQRRDRNA